MNLVPAQINPARAWLDRYVYVTPRVVHEKPHAEFVRLPRRRLGGLRAGCIDAEEANDRTDA